MALLNLAPLHRRSGPFLVLDFGQIQVQMQLQGVTERNLREHLESETGRMQELLKNLPADFQRAIVVMDGSVAILPPAEARNLQAKWITAHRPMLRRLTHKIAFVVPNPWVRAIVAAIFGVAPSPAPMKTFAALDEAIAWAMEESRILGGTVSAELVGEGVEAIHRLRRTLAPDA